MRIGTAAATVGLILAGAIVTAFLADYGLNLSPLQRGCALVGIALVASWGGSRVARRWLGVHENAIDLALLVEQRLGLDRDLVAALQFQSDDAANWGSRRLEQAVMDDADERSHQLDPLAGFSWKPLPARVSCLALSATLLVIVAASFPAHSSAFVRRLSLADVPYPTRTQIESLLINGQSVDLTESAPLRAPAGQPLLFQSTWAGERPHSGTVMLKGDSGAAIEIVLQASDDSASYVGSLESITEPLTFTLRVGDDETRPRRIETVPLPVVALDLVPTPPAYARENAPAAPPAGVRTAIVLPGSSVSLRVRSGNKPLARAEVILAANGESIPLTIPLRPSADRRTWRLEQPSKTPFADVQKPIAFSVKVVDQDGLSPTESLTGSLRLRQDRAPRVAASVVVRRVLPTGRPELTYRASDDFGIKELKTKLTVRHQDGTETAHETPLSAEQTAKAEFSGRQPLDLSSLRLVKGDQVIVTVTAEDVRGPQAGEVVSSEPITLEVTDREGLLSGLLESDEEGAERLDAIIRRELGIGAQR